MKLQKLHKFRHSLHFAAITLVTLFFFKVHAQKLDIDYDGKLSAYLDQVQLQLSQVTIDPNSNPENGNVALQDYKQLNKLTGIFQKFVPFEIQYGKRIRNKIEDDKVLTGDELFYLKKMIALYYQFSEKLMNFSMKYEGHWRDRHRSLIDDQTYFLKQLIWTTSNLMGYDGLIKNYEIYYEEGKFRRIIKALLKEKDDPARNFSKSISDLFLVSGEFSDSAHSGKLKKQIIVFREMKEEFNARYGQITLVPETITLLLENESSINLVDHDQIRVIRTHDTIDLAVYIFNDIIDYFSGLFGNTVGFIKWRKGHLYQNPTAESYVRRQLQPLDILVEKTPFALTDKLIPGNFGHAAIYLGTKEQLIKIGMWDHPVIRKFQTQIAQGKVVLEAVRPGVGLSTLEHFMNIDELAILRKKNALIDPKEIAEYYERGLAQIGKKYDFNFDVSTLDKIVCSELVYIVFGDINWPTKYRLGRQTVTPDNISEINLFENSPIQLILYIDANSNKVPYHQKDQKDLANNLNFRFNKELSTPETPWYEKEITRCFMTEKEVPKENKEKSLKLKPLGINSERIRERVCRTTYVHYVYETKN